MSELTSAARCSIDDVSLQMICMHETRDAKWLQLARVTTGRDATSTLQTLQDANGTRVVALGDTISNLSNALFALRLLSDFRQHEQALRVALTNAQYERVAVEALRCCEVLQRRAQERAIESISSKCLRLRLRILNHVRIALEELQNTRNLLLLCDVVNTLPVLGASQEGTEFMSDYVHSYLSDEMSNFVEIHDSSKQLHKLFSLALPMLMSCYQRMETCYDDSSMQNFVQRALNSVGKLTSTILETLSSKHEVDGTDEGYIGAIVFAARASNVFWIEVTRHLQYEADADQIIYRDGYERLLVTYAATETRLMRAYCAHAVDSSSHLHELKMRDFHDVCFVLRRSVQRSCTLMSPYAIGSVMKEVSLILREIATHVERNTKVASGVTSAVRLQELGEEILINVNAMDSLIDETNVSLRIKTTQVTETMASLCTSLVMEVQSQTHNDLFMNVDGEVMLQQSLHDLQSITDSFVKISAEVLGMVVQDWLGVMNHVLKGVSLAQYCLSTEQFEVTDTTESWVEPALYMCQLFHKSIQDRHAGSSDIFLPKLLQLLVKRLALLLEMIMFNYLRFNQLGALVFERQIRTFVSGLSTLSQPFARAEFSRLVSACRLLSLEKLTELSDYLEESTGLMLDLASSDVKDILCLREDFAEDDVRKTLEELFVK
tara:strand:- start:1873 stop:3861 length:1989 start_codon:yes stop_codon:yes gene_type:complete